MCRTLRRKDMTPAVVPGLQRHLAWLCRGWPLSSSGTEGWGGSCAESPASEISFELDIQPILTARGCNSGPCHGKARGQNGFQLSLFGFDSAVRLRLAVQERARATSLSRRARTEPAAAEGGRAASSWRRSADRTRRPRVRDSETLDRGRIAAADRRRTAGRAGRGFPE